MIDPKGESLAYRMGWRTNCEDVRLTGDGQPTVEEQWPTSIEIKARERHDEMDEQTIAQQR